MSDEAPHHDLIDIIKIDRAGGHYIYWVGRLTSDDLHSKADIAAVLAWYRHELATERERADRAEAELDRERMRLAACSVVALANTAETAAEARDMRPDYDSASVRDVAAAVDREMALRERVARLRAVIESALNDVCRISLCEANSMSSRQEMGRIARQAAERLRVALAEAEESRGPG